MTIPATGLSVIRSGRTILHPTDVGIRPGERVGLVGASGSGKSTLGHALIDTLRAQGVDVAHVPQSTDEALDHCDRRPFTGVRRNACWRFRRTQPAEGRR